MAGRRSVPNDLVPALAFAGSVNGGSGHRPGSAGTGLGSGSNRRPHTKPVDRRSSQHETDPAVPIQAANGMPRNEELENFVNLLIEEAAQHQRLTGYLNQVGGQWP